MRRQSLESTIYGSSGTGFLFTVILPPIGLVDCCCLLRVSGEEREIEKESRQVFSALSYQTLVTASSSDKTLAEAISTDWVALRAS